MSDLEKRIEALERKTKTLPISMLLALAVMLGAALVQFKINAELREQIESIHRQIGVSYER